MQSMRKGKREREARSHRCLTSRILLDKLRPFSILCHPKSPFVIFNSSFSLSIGRLAVVSPPATSTSISVFPFFSGNFLCGLKIVHAIRTLLLISGINFTIFVVRGCCLHLTQKRKKYTTLHTHDTHAHTAFSRSHNLLWPEQMKNYHPSDYAAMNTAPTARRDHRMSKSLYGLCSTSQFILFVDKVLRLRSVGK